MADPAREEADRYFSSRTQPTSHPEDRDNLSDHSQEEDEQPSKRSKEQDSSDDDEDTDKMATMTQTRSNYHIPSTTHYANTGPKGVIADAQSFARAKQSSSFRSRLANFTNGISFKPQPTTTTIEKERKSKVKSDSSGSEKGLSEDDSDSEFMNTWRQARINELQQSQGQDTRRVSPSRRVWGALSEVDANGYLDAIEKVSDDEIVIVLIYDDSNTSRQVEDELGMLAYKFSTMRFVKLHQDIAEMESIQVPAVLAYKAGDVFATVSGAKGDGLEGVLKKHRVLPS